MSQKRLAVGSVAAELLLDGSKGERRSPNMGSNSYHSIELGVISLEDVTLFLPLPG